MASAKPPPSPGGGEKDNASTIAGAGEGGEGAVDEAPAQEAEAPAAEQAPVEE